MCLIHNKCPKQGTCRSMAKTIGISNINGMRKEKKLTPPVKLFSLVDSVDFTKISKMFRMHFTQMHSMSVSLFDEAFILLSFAGSRFCGHLSHISMGQKEWHRVAGLQYMQFFLSWISRVSCNAGKCFQSAASDAVQMTLAQKCMLQHSWMRYGNTSILRSACV